MAGIAQPDPDFTPNPVVTVLAAGTRLTRLYARTHSQTALTFRRFGPIHRFDHHRSSGAPDYDPERAVLYAAYRLAGAVVETFGDSREIITTGRYVARYALNRDLLMLDLRRSGAMRAGTTAAISKIADRVLTQTYARHFYERDDLFGRVDGLLYYNSHNDDEALALFERAEAALECIRDDPLDAPHYRLTLLAIARDNGMEFAD